MPTEIDDDYDLLRSTFPPLSYLLNLEEHLVQKLLLECRLLKQKAQAKGNGLVSPMLQLWGDFIREYGIDIEGSTCKIGGKARFMVRVGAWSKDHPSLTPQQVWRKASSIKIPKLRVDRLMHEFAAKIGAMNLDDVIDPRYEKLLCTPSPEDSNSSSDTNGGESDEQNGEKATEEQPCNIFDAVQFLLLHSLGLCRRNMLDHLIQELVKFFGKQSISFFGANNWNTDLFVMPSC
jgi:hypothetical protein